MAETATAVLALWNDVAGELDAAYNDWHAREHVPERLTVTGMLWGLRYRRLSGPMPQYLTLYGLGDAAVLESDAYRKLLSEPTPASRRMRPALQNISRWVCSVRALQSLDRGDCLAVVPLDSRAGHGNAAVAALLTEPRLGHLFAERLADAAPLPWLQQGQGRAVEGDTLVCLAQAQSGPPGSTVLPANAGRYQRLETTSGR